MKNLKEMSIHEIYVEMNHLDLYLSDLINISKDFSAYMELVKEYKDEEMWDFIKKHDDKIDKEKLVYVLTEGAREHIIKRKNDNSTNGLMVKQAYKNGRKLLSNCKKTFPIIYGQNKMFYFKSVGSVADLKIDDSKKNHPQNLEFEKMIENDIARYTLIFGIIDEFIPCISKSEENADIFSKILRYNCKRKILKHKMENEEKNDEYYVNYYIEEITEYLKRFPKEFNMEKIMLLSAWRMKNTMENEPEKLDEEEKKQVVKCLKYYGDNIKKHFSIEGNIQVSPFGPEKDSFSYSTDEFRNDLQKIIGEKYYRQEELAQIKSKILNDEMNLSELSNLRLFSLLAFDESELVKLKKDYKNFDILLGLGQINQKEAQKIIEENEFLLEISTIELLYKKRFIDKKSIFNMYFRGNITLDKMMEIVENKEYDIRLRSGDLVNYYIDARKNVEDEEKVNKVKKYGKLFKGINNDNLEDNNEVYDEVIDNLYLHFEDLDLDELYDFEVLPIQTLIDWDGKERIYKLAQNLKLKSEDVAKLIKENQINIQKLGNSLIKSKASKMEIINYICDSFSYPCSSKNEEKERDIIADTLIEYVEMGDSIIEIKDKIKPGKGGHRNPVSPTKKRNRYVSDVLQRWRLLKELDDNCNITSYPDGTTRFDLPNVNGGTVVFEKSLKLVRNQMVPENDRATYIISYADFVKNKSLIEQQVIAKKNRTNSNTLTVNRSMLTNMYINGQAERITHSVAWGERVKEKIGGQCISLYGKDKEDRIDSLISKILKSRTLVD